MKSARLLAVALLLVAATTPSIAATNEAPLADAGLDQTVTRGTTVYLDGGGSRDPDGAVERYDWTITAESGDATNATSPRCGTCQQTQFSAERTGTYRVTLEVTDGSGATSTDTLYVTVEPGDPPVASLSGPTQTSTGDPARFAADLSAGSAPLDQLVWHVDGERVATEPASGDANSTTRTVRFPTTGTHSVAVTAIDEDGQRDTAETSITVVEPTETRSEGGGSAGTTGDTDVVGPQVVTGHGELTAEYRLTGGASGTWMLDSRRVDSGSSTTRSFTPGIHELYAATGSGVATFSDGSRTVVADPAPELTTVDVENESVVPVSIDATDDYENLHTVTVHVDGEPTKTITTDDLGGRVSGDSLHTTTYLQSLEPGSHTITVRARDTRGQTDVAIRTVEVPGPPEVVSAGFVQDGPLDQYHPRLDESRYTATYRVEVDLNGVEPERIESFIQPFGTPWNSELNRSLIGDETLVVEKSTYKERVSDISATSMVNWRGGEYYNRTSDSIPITYASPELRIRTLDPQTEYNRLRGMVLDASESFDPDGSTINYHWQKARGDEENQPTVSLSSNNIFSLKISDKQGQYSNTTNPINWFAPKIVNVDIKGDGPFYPNETVTVSAKSERYYLTKPTYENLTSFDVHTEYGYVSDHSLTEEAPGKVNDPDPEAQGHYHQWSLKIPAEAFRDGPINISTYPTAHPEVQYSYTIEPPKIYVSSHQEIKNIETSVEYLVERPEYTFRQTTNKDVYSQLLDSGYQLQEVDKSGKEFHLEKYTKTRSAKFDVDRESFYERGRRQFFLSSNPEWSANGTKTETQTWTTTEKVWRSHRGGSGTFTGNTRREKVKDGSYRTEKKFKYETTESYEKTITYEDTYETEVSKVDSVKKCNSFGCRRYQTTVEKTVERTVTRTKEVTRSYEVDRTYWSTRPRRPSHEYTGDIRRVTVREPVYERQYEFEVERQHSESRIVYLTEKRTLVEPAAYEWQDWKIVDNQVGAQITAESTDARIAEIETSDQWTVKKQTGMKTKWTSQRSGKTVKKTLGRADVTLTRYYARNDTKLLPEMESREVHRTVEYIRKEDIKPERVVDILTNRVLKKYDE